MKKIVQIIVLLHGICIFSQKIKSVETIFIDNISIRAIEIYNNKVWYSGTESKFGFIDLANPQDQKQIKLAEHNLQFRTLAQNENSFFAINIESPAYFFEINKIDLKPNIVFTDTTKTAFYDALHFVNDTFGIAFSDPDNHLELKLAVLEPQKKFYNFYKTRFANHDSIKLNQGEAAFAASNTNISSYKNTIWVATGGKSARIFKRENETWKVFNTPFVQGESSQGIYSIDFYDDSFGIAVGGDYKQQHMNLNNIATTHDGGQTWTIQASGQNSGYMTCVKIKPRSKGKEIVAVGDQHISYSSDFGKTWKKISDEKGFYVCKWVDVHTLVLAGKDKIALMKLK
ncbi:glycosyl hydrolase [Chryseobacterium nematophagum]|uniref:Glycosyl hydrolase n=1 Tax=Chryseobacterium nematophagum TaxID=2305228 RepID=A0A3M7LE84_9FLAO|nr:glycosyl hydrolase [Chryseobacterium nematophagum]RMZ59806.1 glycosyl hydrolase [Chryseobacterium nematophagum]